MFIFIAHEMITTNKKFNKLFSVFYALAGVDFNTRFFHVSQYFLYLIDPVMLRLYLQ